MKKIDTNIEKETDELLPEYKIDYTKVKRNPYFKQNKVYVEIDEEVAKAFKTPQNINRALKAIAKTLPKGSAATY
jgi:hypothetical protein